MFKDVTRDELKTICEKYGFVESLTLKTKIVNGEVQSRGIAIIQYADKA